MLKTIPGVGRILALTILYEVGDIQCFEPIRKFTSYARLEKCKAEPAGKRYVEKLQKRMNKSKVLSALAHKLGRAVYLILKDKRVFDEQRFLRGWSRHGLSMTSNWIRKDDTEDCESADWYPIPKRFPVTDVEARAT